MGIRDVGQWWFDGWNSFARAAGGSGAGLVGARIRERDEGELRAGWEPVTSGTAGNRNEDNAALWERHGSRTPEGAGRSQSALDTAGGEPCVDRV